jgi:restriction system protein
VELPLLKVLADTGQLPMLEAVDKVTTYFDKITPDDLASRLKTGSSRWRNSVQWARQRLITRGELDGSVRGIWKITDKGRARLEKEWVSWEPKYRKEDEERYKMVSGKRTTVSIEAGTATVLKEEILEQSPQEVIEDALDALNQNLEREILSNLLTLDPSLFESAIGDLLEKMGYGEVHVTGRSGDGGD